MEIETLEELDDFLTAGRSLRGARLQALDLTAYGDRLREQDDLTGLVVLGGTVPPGVLQVLLRRGAIVFPAVTELPVDPWRGLYLPQELYAGIEAGGYAATPDARAHAWSVDSRLRTDAYATLVRAIHDDSVTDELDEFVAGRSVVGVMGGHAVARGTQGYAAAGRLGHALAEAGHLVATGGGPGAMEAANLGALCRGPDQLSEALRQLAGVPGFLADVTSWALLGLRVRRAIVGEEPPAAPDTLGPSARSLGMPTWFYGHEPPNVFCDVVAKYFSNATREDGLLARCNGGLVVLPGAAGTVQEVFQAVTPLYYAAADTPLPPLVLVGEQHWTQRVPVWEALQALAQGRRMAQSLHLVDELDTAVARIAT